MGSNSVTVTIPISAAQSAPIAIDNKELVGIQMPAGWSSSANLTFLTSADNVTYQALYDATGSEVNVPVLQATNVGLGSYVADIAPWPYIKLRSGTAASEVIQTATRTFKIVLK
jgi:hypothetical protein